MWFARAVPEGEGEGEGGRRPVVTCELKEAHAKVCFCLKIHPSGVGISRLTGLGRLRERT